MIELKKYTLCKGGKKEMPMPILNFRLSDREKHDAIWNLLNVDYTEENKWVVDFGIMDIYDGICYSSQI